ncbi:MAG: hypothetical protein RRY95_02290 [Oscillospiraceae bacterium]
MEAPLTVYIASGKKATFNAGLTGDDTPLAPNEQKISYTKTVTLGKEETDEGVSK